MIKYGCCAVTGETLNVGDTAYLVILSNNSNYSPDSYGNVLYTPFLPFEIMIGEDIPCNGTSNFILNYFKEWAKLDGEPIYSTIGWNDLIENIRKIELVVDKDYHAQAGYETQPVHVDYILIGSRAIDMCKSMPVQVFSNGWCSVPYNDLVDGIGSYIDHIKEQKRASDPNLCSDTLLYKVICSVYSTSYANIISRYEINRMINEAIINGSEYEVNYSCDILHSIVDMCAIYGMYKALGIKFIPNNYYCLDEIGAEYKRKLSKCLIDICDEYDAS